MSDCTQVLRVFEYVFWVQKSHLGLRRGYLGALLGRLGGNLGPPWGYVAPRLAILGLSLENSGSTLVSLGLRNSCEVDMVDFTKVL